ncbi:hypothetical protein, partial [Halomonas elongata]|uniref:hypothetical protein n=1 Tax=Halomonas elongata TaxID=2746 RepID=UPI0023B0350F
WKLEAGSWKLEAGSWKLEAGSWKLEESMNPDSMGSRFFLPASSLRLQAPGKAGDFQLQAYDFKLPAKPGTSSFKLMTSGSGRSPVGFSSSL